MSSSFPQQPFFGNGTDTDTLYGDNSNAVKISTEVMVAAVIFLFALVVFLFFLYLYARRFLSPSPSLSLGLHTLSRRYAFAAPETAVRRGLDPAVLASLPVNTHRTSEFPDVECSVCLSEVADGDQLRLLPACKHAFHVECIDMWFHSHSTCPLCRTSVAGEQSPATVQIPEETSPETAAGNFPTNVLFWGTQDSVNSRGSPAAIAGDGGREVSSRGGLVIDVPSRGGAVEGFSPAGRLAGVEEAKSPGSARFGRLRRLWSLGRMMAGSSSSGGVSPSFRDVEMGETSSKTPTTNKIVISS